MPLSLNGSTETLYPPFSQRTLSNDDRRRVCIDWRAVPAYNHVTTTAMMSATIKVVRDAMTAVRKDQHRIS